MDVVEIRGLHVPPKGGQGGIPRVLIFLANARMRLRHWGPTQAWRRDWDLDMVSLPH